MILNDQTISSLKQTLKNIKNNPDLELRKKQTKMTKCLKFLELNDVIKMKVSIYSGCDYVENLKGLGFGTIIN